MSGAIEVPPLDALVHAGTWQLARAVAHGNEAAFCLVTGMMREQGWRGVATTYALAAAGVGGSHLVAQWGGQPGSAIVAWAEAQDPATFAAVERENRALNNHWGTRASQLAEAGSWELI